MANPFCHLELASTDIAKAKAFYSSLFDWKLSDMEMGNGMTYTTFKPADDSPGGGMMAQPNPGAPSAWLPYVLVDDVKAAAAKAKTLGANVVMESQEVPNMGWFSIIIDPAGAALGLWQTMKE
jgi:predicted enzyme related to lactoylglutathione lyase